jgi:predicted lysophospholipase L1 biosynthesis ABC-type transport system permease subunit
VALRVVGIGLLPELPGHSAYDQGLWVTTDGWGRIGTDAVANRLLLLQLDDTGAGEGAVAAVLTASFGFPLAVETPAPPAAAQNLETVRPLPLALGVFLAALALGVSTHAVTTTIRRRRHDLAVLRALGATRRQIRVVIASQATTIGLVGILLGVPLGLVAGREGWGWVARSVPFVDASPTAVLATILVVPAVLAAVNVVAALPARRAGRVGPAEVLRTE